MHFYKTPILYSRRVHLQILVFKGQMDGINFPRLIALYSDI